MSTELQVVEKGSPARSKYVMDRLVAINRQAEEIIIENGLLLREYKDNGYWREDGYESFDSAIDSLHEKGVLDYRARNARNFIAVVDMLEKHNLGAEAIKGIGISKLREIATLKNIDEQKRLLGGAGEMDVSTVQREAKKARDKAAGRDVDPLQPYTIMTTETGHQFVKECLSKARRVHALSDAMPDGAVLVDAILPEWNSGVNEAKSIDAEFTAN
jgi:hypothetical protein